MHQDDREVDEYFKRLADMIRCNGWWLTIEHLHMMANGVFADEDLASALEETLIPAQECDFRLGLGWDQETF